jgi:ABC-2 type transport system permease protein
MSAVDLAPAVPVRRVSSRFLRSEVRLIMVRRRNQAGLAALAAVPIVIAVATKLAGPGDGDGDGPNFFAQITGNGFFVALAALGVELVLFLPIAIAMVSGDAIAGEANVGTLRYLLTVPAGRTRVLAIKYAGIVFGAFLAPLVVAASGLVGGLILFGGGDVSTLSEQPMGAAIALTMLSVASVILSQIPQVDWLHPYLLTQHWQDFGELLRDPVSLGALRPGLLSAGAYIVIFLSAAWARFSGRDVTS